MPVCSSEVKVCSSEIEDCPCAAVRLKSIIRYKCTANIKYEETFAIMKIGILFVNCHSGF